jgi:hypothetical protein
MQRRSVPYAATWIALALPLAVRSEAWANAWQAEPLEFLSQASSDRIGPLRGALRALDATGRQALHRQAAAQLSRLEPVIAPDGSSFEIFAADNDADRIKWVLTFLRRDREVLDLSVRVGCLDPATCHLHAFCAEYFFSERDARIYLQNHYGNDFRALHRALERAKGEAGTVTTSTGPEGTTHHFRFPAPDPISSLLSFGKAFRISLVETRPGYAVLR